jgi:hypothetical protein
MKRKTDIGVKIKFSTFKNLKLLTDSYAFVMLMQWFCVHFRSSTDNLLLLFNVTLTSNSLISISVSNQHTR